MKLSQWAKNTGVSYRTAWRWFKAGTLPVEAVQMPTGTIIVQVDRIGGGGAGLYARVSSSDRKNDLEAQLGRLASYAAQNKLTVVKVVSEIGSGLDGRRPKLMTLLADPAVTVIVVEHRDRLMRFGVEYLESALAAQGRRVLAIPDLIQDTQEAKDDLVRDTIEVLTSFCARLYGRREARTKARKAIQALDG
ncbi:MAG: IS607 family transposase [Hyphomicrobiaceae bacterium]